MPKADAETKDRRKVGKTVRLIILVISVIYLILGIGGFFVPGTPRSVPTPPSYAIHDPHYALWIFSVSPLLNVMHTIVGVFGLVAARKVTSSRVFAFAISFWFFGVTAYGILVAALGTGDRLNLNWPDVIVHGATAITGILVALVSARSGVDSSAVSKRPGKAEFRQQP